ncbi:hypothetical protein PISMIDRAFT_681629 [Pisolithus microcarpus 441]|uniref:Uncharacterized protein n=1 Tax=Pisolithus microcarpus 441 TaxID=765257 RepID=A0A0C9Y8V2_9AGAM|nr:hypothetical protein PISMIDRAFT_681629 [Pisolithus microcarpus 441]
MSYSRILAYDTLSDTYRTHLKLMVKRTQYGHTCSCRCGSENSNELAGHGGATRW